MRFEWDETKRRANIRKHGVDFVRAALIFENAVLTRRDTRRDYGEDRYISLGMIETECSVLVWTERQESRRIISAWKGGQDDREEFRKRISR
jgi:uncharacterized DUF497 family protein